MISMAPGNLLKYKTVRQTIQLDYEELVSAYWNNLTTVLRSFSVGQDLHFLDAWVPEDDAMRSILGVLEAARDRGLECILVVLGEETLSRVDQEDLCRAAGTYGSVQTERRGTKLDLQITFSRWAPNSGPGPDVSKTQRGTHR